VDRQRRNSRARCLRGSRQLGYFNATELEFEVPTLFVIVTASDSIASMFPRTLNVTAVVKRLPKLWDGELWYQTLNGPFTGKSRLVVSSLRSGLLDPQRQ
jgi:hypothetical protein